MEWISINDRLPESTDRYLVIRDGRIEIETYFFQRSGISYFYDYLGITHWMPLPEPPTK